MRLRAGVWALVAVAVVLCTRTVVYAIAPTQATVVAELEHRAGGPRLAVLFGGVIAIATLLAAAALWFAAVAVRERLALDPKQVPDPPRLRPARLAARAVGLWTATTVAFGYFESYLHWRAGLGWHGLACVFGPVHRDAIPVLAALSLLAVALHGAVEHLLRWLRRLVAALAGRLPHVAGATPAAADSSPPRLRRVLAAAEPRGPPGAFVSVL
jgi:hypothetical protein